MGIFKGRRESAKNNDLDMSEFDFDADIFGDDFDFDTGNGRANNRSPILKHTVAVGKGVGSSLLKRSTVEKVLKNLTPRVYGDMYSNVADGIDRASFVAQDVKDNLNQVKKQTQTILRGMSNTLEEKGASKVAAVLRKFAGKPSSNYGYQRDTVDDTVNNTLEALFTIQSESKKEDRKERLVKEAVDKTRFDNQFRVLGSIDYTLRKGLMFHESNTINYYRKSVELDIRKLHLMNQMYAHTKESNSLVIRALNDIKVNTGLPDYVKLHSSEAFKELTRRRLMTNVQQRLFKGPGEFLSSLADTVGDILKERIGSVRDFMDMATDVSDNATMMSEHMSGTDASNMLGNVVGGSLAARLGRRYRASFKGTKVGQWFEKNAERVGRFNSDPGQATQNFLRSGRIQKFLSRDGKRNLSGVEEGILGFLDDVVSISNNRKLKINIGEDSNQYGHYSGMGGGDLTGKVTNVVIPGYLSRILRELTIIRTGNKNTPLMEYDYSTGQFITQSKNRDALIRSLGENQSTSLYRDTGEDAIRNAGLYGFGSLTSKYKGGLKSGDVQYIGRVLTNAAINQVIVDYDFLSNPANFPDLSKEKHNVFVEGLNKVRENDKKYDLDNMSNFNRIAQNALGKVTVDSNKIKGMLNAGYGHHLMKSGILYSRNGQIFLNNQKLVDAISNRPEVLLDPDGESGEALTMNVNHGKSYQYIGRNTGFSNQQVTNTDTTVSPVNTLIESIRDIQTQMLKTNEEQLQALMAINQMQMNHYTALYNEQSGGTWFRGMQQYMREKTQRTRERLSSLTQLPRAWVRKLWGGASYFTREMFSPMGMLRMQRDLVKNTVGLANKAFTGAKNLMNKALGNVSLPDIYLPGKDTPIIKSIDFSSGSLFNEDGSVIKSPKDIKGNIYNAMGNLLASATELKNAVYKTSASRTFAPLGNLIKGGLKTLSSLVSQGAKSYFKLYTLPFTIATKAFNVSASLYRRLTDIYIYRTNESGEKTLTLGLKVEQIFNGSVYNQDGKPIRSIKDLDSSVEILDSRGNTIISREEVSGGYYNRQGVRLDGLFNRLAMLWRLPAQTVKNTVKRVIKTGLSMAGSITRGITGIFKGAYNKVISLFDGSFRSAWLGNYTMMNETNSILTNILTLLNRRLPGKPVSVVGDMDGDGDRDNSVADLRQRERKRKEEQKSWIEKIKSHQILATMIAKAMGKSKKEKDDDENSLWDKIKGLVGGALSGLGSLGGGLGDLLGGGRGRGKGRTARGKGGRLSRMGRGLGRGVAGSAGKIAGVAGSGIRGIGRGAMGVAGRGLGVLGAGLAAKGMYDSYQESDWGGLALNTGLAGLSLASAGVGLSTLTSVGSFLFTNPIGWGILALGAVSVGGYYLWKKWRTGLIEADYPRIMMYGVHPAKQKDEAETLLKLEGIISEALVDNRDVIAIDEKKVDIAKVLELFNIDPKDIESQEDWYHWFENRFKKPFMDSVQAIKNINPKYTLNDLRDLKTADLARYYRAIKPGANSYREMEPSPFQASSLTTTGKDAADFIDSKLSTDVKNKPNDYQDKMLMNMGSYTPGSMGTFNPPVKGPKNEAEARLGASTSVIIAGSSTLLKKPSTIDRAKFKAYGLISPEQTDLQLAFSSAEQYLSGAIKYQGNRAIFNGDIQKAAEDLAVYFGISKNDTDGYSRLKDYLKLRFIPIYTVYLTQLKELGINDTNGQVSVDKQMSIFKALKTVTNENGQSVWSYTTPISGKFNVLNPNLDSIRFETEEAKRTGSGDSKENRDNRLLSTSERQANNSGFFQRTKDWINDFKNATWTGSGGKLERMWDTTKNAVPVLGMVDTVYNFAKNTVDRVTGGNKEMALMLYTAFRKSGFSHNQARILVGEIGRENGLRKDLIFGYHKDPHSGYNIGMLSWQGDRSAKLQQYLQSKGLIQNGRLVQSPEALQAQTDFIYQEMQQPQYANKISAFLNNPDIDPFTGANIIGKHYIKWRIDDPKYSAQGIRNRNHYVNVLDEALNAKGGAQTFSGLGNNKSGTGHLSNQIVRDPIAHAKSMIAAHQLKQSGINSTVATAGGPGSLLLRNQPAAKGNDFTGFGRNLRNVNSALNGSIPATLAANPTATYKDVARNTSPGNSSTPWMSIAMGEKGVNERDHGSRVREYHRAAGINGGGSTPWCGSFVQWCLTKSGNTGMPLNQGPARAFSWANYGTPYSGGVIPYGAIIVWDFSHVSFCAGVEGNTVLSLGGNQSSQAKGSQRNGGEVTVSRIDIRKVKAVRLPAGYNGQGGSYSDDPSASAYTPPPKPVTLKSLAEAQKAAGDSLKNSSNVYNDAMKMKFGENWKEKMAKESADVKQVKDNTLPENTPILPKLSEALKPIQHLNKDKVTKAIGKIKEAVTGKNTNDDIVPLIAQNDPYYKALKKGNGFALPEVKNPVKNALFSSNDTINLLNGTNATSLKETLAKTKLLRQKYKEINETQFKPESLTRKPDTPLVKQQNSMDIVTQSAMATKQSRDVMEGIYNVNQEILKANREQVNLLKEILREVKSKKPSTVSSTIETTGNTSVQSTGKPTIASPVDLNKKAS